jgi:hypothetical protein
MKKALCLQSGRLRRWLGIMISGLLIGGAGAPSAAWAQPEELTLLDAEEAPLPALEKELVPIAADILHHPDSAHKRRLNEAFLERMKTILKRPASYDYSFDRLQSISRLAPRDDAFRIFTWQIVNQDKKHTYKQHRYYGLIQRKYETESGQERIAVIELKDSMDYTPRIENRELTPDRWLGALYYKPQYSDHGVLTYEGKVARLNGMTGNIRKEQVKYYVLLGYNGNNISSDYKIIESIIIDPEDPAQVSFGVPIFYFSTMPKYRAVFKYSDNSPFSLNQRYVRRDARIGTKKEKMIVFNHLEPPKKSNPVKMWELGSSGSVDALNWFDKRFQRRIGFFGFLRDVAVIQPGIEQYDPAELRKQKQQEMERLREMGVTPPSELGEDQENKEDKEGTESQEQRQQSRRGSRKGPRR